MTTWILIKVYVGMRAFAPIILCFCNVCTVLPDYTASRPIRQALLSPPLELPHILLVIILTARYAWSTDVWVRFIDKYWFRVSQCGNYFCRSAVLTQLRLMHTYHVVPMPHCAALIHTCHAPPLPFSDSAVSFVKVRVVAGNVWTASPTV
jgi:hypothetical protein